MKRGRPFCYRFKLKKTSLRFRVSESFLFLGLVHLLGNHIGTSKPTGF